MKALIALFAAVTIAGGGLAWAEKGESSGSPADDDAVSREVEETEDRMRTWEERMRQVGREADELSQETRERLDRAWEDTQERWDRARDASREQWDRARDGLDDAMGRLERAWEAATEEQPDEEQPEAEG